MSHFAFHFGAASPVIGMALRRPSAHHRRMSNFAHAPDPTLRLRIATRIHFALLRHYGEQVGVGTLLNGSGEAREALWVCAASGQPELVALAKQFVHMARAAEPAADGAAPQDAVWAQDTSGFGLSRPADEESAPASRPDMPAGWLNPARWLRRSVAR